MSLDLLNPYLESSGSDLFTRHLFKEDPLGSLVALDFILGKKQFWPLSVKSVLLKLWASYYLHQNHLESPVENAILIPHSRPTESELLGVEL